MKRYLCGITFQHELNETDEVSIYDTLEELEAAHPCYTECGVVEVEVDDPDFWKKTDLANDAKSYSSHRWVVKQNLSWGKPKPGEDASVDFVDKMRDEWDEESNGEK